MVISLPDEIWKDIPGYEGLYQASNLGRLKALDKTYYTGENLLARRFKKEHILKFSPDRNGYLRVALSKNGSASTLLAHRIIGKVFLPNPENKPEVNHKYGDKNDIKAASLEWATKAENAQHAFNTGLNKGHKLGKHPKAKIVLDTNTGIFYDCMKEAAVAKSMSYKNLQNRLIGVVPNNTGLIFA